MFELGSYVNNILTFLSSKVVCYDDQNICFTISVSIVQVYILVLKAR